MTSATCSLLTATIPRDEDSYERWNEHFTLPSYNETDTFFAAFETSDADSSASNNVDWDVWITSYESPSPDNTLMVDSSLNSEGSIIETPRENFQLEMRSSLVLDSAPTHTSSTTVQVTETLSKTALKQSEDIIGDIACEQKSSDRAGKGQPEKQLRALRYHLQNGLLTKGKPAKVDIMADMSSYLSDLESLKPSATAISVSKIPKLLRAILRLKEIPKDNEFRFKERTKIVLDNLNTILDAADPFKESSSPPKAAYHLVKEITEFHRISPTKNSHAPKVVEDRKKASSLPQPSVIDLTVTDNESETSPRVYTHELNVGVKTPKPRKRKRADNSAPSLGVKVTSRQSKRMKKVQDYLPLENMWISTALKWIEDRVKENDGDVIEVKRSDLLGLRDKLEVWRVEDLNVTRNLELLE